MIFSFQFSSNLDEQTASRSVRFGSLQFWSLLFNQLLN